MLPFSIVSPKDVKGPKDNASLLRLLDFIHINLPRSCRKGSLGHKTLTGALPQSRFLDRISYITSKNKQKKNHHTKKLENKYLFFVPSSKTVWPPTAIFTITRELTTHKHGGQNKCAFFFPNTGVIFILSNKFFFVVEISQTSTNIRKLDVPMCNSPMKVAAFFFIWSFCGAVVHFFSHVNQVNLA